jgi:hypothetical protein
MSGEEFANSGGIICRLLLAFCWRGRKSGARGTGSVGAALGGGPVGLTEWLRGPEKAG